MTLTRALRLSACCPLTDPGAMSVSSDPLVGGTHRHPSCLAAHCSPPRMLACRHGPSRCLAREVIATCVLHKYRNVSSNLQLRAPVGTHRYVLSLPSAVTKYRDLTAYSDSFCLRYNPNMRSTIITAVLALAYGITTAVGMAAPLTEGTDGSSQGQCAKLGDYCWVGGIEGPSCCDGLYCRSDTGILPPGVSSLLSSPLENQ